MSIPSPEGESPRRRRPRDRKQQILVVARELFTEHGFPNVTMARIADRVGITAGALYRHFGNKTVLLEEIIADNFAWLDDPVTSTDYEKTIEDALARVVDRPYLSDLWTHEVRYLPEPKLADIRRRMIAWNQSLRTALRTARRDLDAGQEELLGWAVMSLMSSVGRRAMHAPLSERLACVRSASRAVTSVQLVPTGPPIPAPVDCLRVVSVRERLLVAAQTQFAERGYQDTSMTSLGAAANVTGSNLYGYFDSKADVLQAVLERGTHALWLGLGDVLTTAPSADVALPRLVRSYIAAARSWAWALEDPLGDTALHDATVATQREYVGEWVALLRQVTPNIGPRDAKTRVQIGLFLISDLLRNRRVANLTSFEENLANLVVAVLVDGPRSPMTDCSPTSQNRSATSLHVKS